MVSTHMQELRDGDVAGSPRPPAGWADAGGRGAAGRGVLRPSPAVSLRGVSYFSELNVSKTGQGKTSQSIYMSSLNVRAIK